MILREPSYLPPGVMMTVPCGALFTVRPMGRVEVYESTVVHGKIRYRPILRLQVPFEDGVDMLRLAFKVDAKVMEQRQAERQVVSDE